jgi:hypothetical protein
LHSVHPTKIAPLTVCLPNTASNRTTFADHFLPEDLRREPGDVEKESIEYFERLNVEVIVVGTKATNSAIMTSLTRGEKMPRCSNRAPRHDYRDIADEEYRSGPAPQADR